MARLGIASLLLTLGRRAATQGNSLTRATISSGDVTRPAAASSICGLWNCGTNGTVLAKGLAHRAKSAVSCSRFCAAT
eukprot:2015479-Amphidinium_carterae.1